LSAEATHQAGFAVKNATNRGKTFAMSTTTDQLIRAAGAVLWRRSEADFEIAIVHRKRYDGDWTLPKGKLEGGESWRDAALREVKEETGYDAKILEFAGALTYQVDGKPKVVRYWHMLAQGKPSAHLDDEVEAVVWLPLDAAVKQLNYPLEQALVQQSHEGTDFLKAHMGSRRRRFVGRISLQRLGATIETMEPELDALIEEAKQRPGNRFVGGWDRRSKRLLECAKQAHKEGDAERGWRCLKAADRFSFYGLGQEELKNEARLILAEAADNEKALTRWRRTGIRESLIDENGKLKNTLNVTDVVRAKRTLDEHHDNVYNRLAILKFRLRLLTLLSLVALGIWLARPPFSPAIAPAATSIVSAETVTNALSARGLWFAVILAGAFGAIVSGFSSSIGTDQNRTRIPAALSDSTTTFARFSLAMVSALVISIFLLSGFLNLSKPSLEWL
jgi:8-oxo-dGTP pyrophosphatase MutT (NUDIX family)